LFNAFTTPKISDHQIWGLKMAEQRYFVVFPPQSMPALRARAVLPADRVTPVSSARQPGVSEAKNQPGVLIAAVPDVTLRQFENEGGKIYPDVQFKICDAEVPPEPAAQYWHPRAAPALDLADRPGLPEVTKQINAPAAWEYTKGSGSTIAIVDTGIDPDLREIGPARRVNIDIPSFYQAKHWFDEKGHGSMCAAIAAGSKSDGGKHDGVAPEATVIAARSTLGATDIFLIYDELISAKRQGMIPGPLVISNSYALYACENNVLESDHPYLSMILQAIDNGIVVVFAAGNNHHDVTCKYPANECGPNTIWGVNSHDRVISVGAVDANGSNQTLPNPHVNSSRGPGEWAKEHLKPDVVAPTYGEIVWGNRYRPMDWWGTSGACPQVAGLAALLLSIAPRLQPAQIADIIRNTAQLNGARNNCVGHGVVDCGKAMQIAVSMA
jgi:subtilisin family serine protease